MLWRVHWCFMLMCDICVFTECYANMSKGSETFDCDRTSSMRIQLFLSHFFLVVAVLSIDCDAAQRHRGMYTGVICDLGWSLVNMVLLHWSCQSDSQSVSFRKRGWERVKTHTERGDPTERIPSSQSQATELLKWCRFSQEACRVELGEGGPNVTLATLKSLPVNYHKRHDGLDNCYWTL